MFKTQRNIFAILISLLSVSAVYADTAEETSRFILALGRFHPVLLHIPIGALVFIFLLDIVGRIRKKYPKDSIKLGLGFSSGFAIITCILGYCLSLEGGYSEEPLSIHFYTGIAAAVLITILASWFAPRFELIGSTGNWICAVAGIASFTIGAVILSFFDIPAWKIEEETKKESTEQEDREGL